MLYRALLLIIASLGIETAANAAAPVNPGYAYYEIGNTAAARSARTERALMLVGGGAWDHDAFRWFAAKAGHGHLVVIGASGGAEDGEEFYREIGGFASVQTIVFSDRKASFDPRVLGILRKADAIFIMGGDQAKYVRFWKGTPVAQAINAEVATGHPVGGTSAGLAILGASGYGAMDGGSIDSETALKDPLGPAVTIVRDFLHMPYLQHVVTDTHFMARNRLGRLIAFIGQVRVKWDPRTIGLGIDEGSALCVDANGKGRFFTSRNGQAWLVRPVGIPRAIKGKPLDWASVRITRFGPSGTIDLRSLRVTNGKVAVISVHRGKLVGNPAG